MNKKLLFFLLFTVAFSLFACQNETKVKREETVHTIEEDEFEFTLADAKTNYYTGEQIEILALLQYNGDEATFATFDSSWVTFHTRRIDERFEYTSPPSGAARRITLQPEQMLVEPYRFEALSHIQGIGKPYTEEHVAALNAGEFEPGEYEVDAIFQLNILGENENTFNVILSTTFTVTEKNEKKAKEKREAT